MIPLYLVMKDGKPDGVYAVPGSARSRADSIGGEIATVPLRGNRAKVFKNVAQVCNG